MLTGFCKRNNIGLLRNLFVPLKKNDRLKNYNVNKAMIEGDMKTVLGRGVLNRRKMNSGVFPVLVWKKRLIFLWMIFVWKGGVHWWDVLISLNWEASSLLGIFEMSDRKKWMAFWNRIREKLWNTMVQLLLLCTAGFFSFSPISCEPSARNSREW